MGCAPTTFTISDTNSSEIKLTDAHVGRQGLQILDGDAMRTFSLRDVSAIEVNSADYRNVHGAVYYAVKVVLNSGDEIPAWSGDSTSPRKAYVNVGSVISGRNGESTVSIPLSKVTRLAIVKEKKTAAEPAYDEQFDPAAEEEMAPEDTLPAEEQ